MTDLDKLIQELSQQIIKTHRELVKIPSVEQQPLEGMPFGEPCYRALEYILEKARELGFEKTVNLDGYAGYIEAGEGREELGILVHADVVPTGSGWTVPPFKAVVKDNKIYGRGAEDNKCGIIASLFALYALCQSGHKFNKRVRLIIGCNEETGMRCIEYYKKKEKLPDIAFSPDADYPLINMEKGILHVELIFTSSIEGKGVKVLSAEAGERPNMVPSKAEMVITGIDFETVRNAAVRLQKPELPINVEERGENIYIRTSGISAHAMCPDEGINAIATMLELLYLLPHGEGIKEKALYKIAEKIGAKTDGKNIGLDIQDKSGKLTLNIGMMQIRDGYLKVTLDIRYPVSCDHEYVVEKLKHAFGEFDINILEAKPGHYVAEDDPLVAKLLEVYHQKTGNPAYAIATGGGTYARTMNGRAVAFGTSFPGRPKMAHRPDEYIEIDDIILNTKIIASAIKSLTS